MFAEQAKVNQKQSKGRGRKGSSTLTDLKPTDTREEVAKLAGVSHDTVSKVKAILEEAEPEVVEQVRSGEVSVNALAH